MNGTQALMLENIDDNAERVMPYVRGSYPRQGALSWFRAGRILGIANLFGNHWVCYEVSFDLQCITVYDSMSRRTNWEDVAAEFQYMKVNLPWIIRHAALWVGRA